MRVTIGYVLLLGSLLLFFSLLSFTSGDSTLFLAHPNQPVKNIVGPFGLQLASLLVFFYGKSAAYILNFAFFSSSIYFLRKESLTQILGRFAFFMSAALSLSVFLGLSLPSSAYTHTGLAGQRIGLDILGFAPRLLAQGFFGFLFVLSLTGTIRALRKLMHFLSQILATILFWPLKKLGIVQERPLEEFEGQIPDMVLDPSPINNIRWDGFEENLEKALPSSPFGRNSPEWIHEPQALDDLMEDIQESYDPFSDIYPHEEYIERAPENAIIRESDPQIPSFLSDGSYVASEAVTNVPEPLPSFSWMQGTESPTNPDPFQQIDQNSLQQHIDIDATHPPFLQAQKAQDLDAQAPYYLPSLDYLFSQQVSHVHYPRSSDDIVLALRDQGASVTALSVTHGPKISQHTLRFDQMPAVDLPGLLEYLSQTLRAYSLRYSTFGRQDGSFLIEIPHTQPQEVYLGDCLRHPGFPTVLPLALGQDCHLQMITPSLLQLGHLFVAGSAHSELRQVQENLLLGMLAQQSPQDLRFLCLDSRGMDLKDYETVPHMLSKFVAPGASLNQALSWIHTEIARRHHILTSTQSPTLAVFNDCVRHVDSLPETERARFQNRYPMPYLVIWACDLVDLIPWSDENHARIQEMLSLSPLVGIHWIVFTRSPFSIPKDIIQCFPGRLMLYAEHSRDSLAVLDMEGAAALLGQGDALFFDINHTREFRIQSPITTKEDPGIILQQVLANSHAEYELEFDLPSPSQVEIPSLNELSPMETGPILSSAQEGNTAPSALIPHTPEDGAPMESETFTSPSVDSKPAEIDHTLYHNPQGFSDAVHLMPSQPTEDEPDPKPLPELDEAIPVPYQDTSYQLDQAFEARLEAEMYSEEGVHFAPKEEEEWAETIPPIEALVRPLVPEEVPEPPKLGSKRNPFTPQPEGDYRFPDTRELENAQTKLTGAQQSDEMNHYSHLIEATFAEFGMDIRVQDISRGPSISRYEVILPSGMTIRRITNLADDLALNIGSSHVRIVYPIETAGSVGLEIPNQLRESIGLREMLESAEFQNSDYELPAILGKDIAGRIVIHDIATMPHLLIAGTTGSGKSVYVNCLIAGLLFIHRPEQLRLILIDPKMVELELYNGIPHLLSKVITQPEEALSALNWAVEEMNARYQLLSECSCRNIREFNNELPERNHARQKKGLDLYPEMSYIVIVIDEFANLMLRSPKETEQALSRLASMARAVGMHLVVATQRPSVDVVTGIIKANFPCRVAFRVSSKIDARTILDKNGAEVLMGRGDMLYMSPGQMNEHRIQAPFISNRDVESIVKQLKMNDPPSYDVDFSQTRNDSSAESATSDYKNDPLYAEILRYVVDAGEVSASSLQRRFRIGFNRASRFMDALKEMQILSPPSSNGKAWTVTISKEDLIDYI